MRYAGEWDQMMFADRSDGNVFDHDDIILGFAGNDLDFPCWVSVQAAADFLIPLRYSARLFLHARPSQVFANALQNQTDPGSDLDQIHFLLCTHLVVTDSLFGAS